MTIYYHGCKCGKIGSLIRKVSHYASVNSLSLTQKNSKYNAEAQQEHVAYLKSYDLDISSYTPIVVEGDKITLLKLWNPS